MKVTLVAPFLIFICISYVSSCTLEDERRPLPVGPMFSFGAFFSGERMIPRKDLQVTIIENRHSAVIKLESKQWNITGCSVLESPQVKVYEVTIDDVHGIASKNGGVKQIGIRKLPRQRVVVNLNSR